MYDPEDQVNPIIEDRTPQAEQTDRVNGEYHYKNGYTQRIYSDAHYVREDETTVPPRYYTPPEKPVREARPPKEKKTVGLGALIALCLVCALLGGLCGGAVAGSLMDSRMDKLETNVAELGETASKPVLVPTAPGTTVAKSDDEGGLSAGDIYDMACEQVVGITTEVTGTNLFGMPVSGAVTGSGFIISEDGYILTNYHVVEEANKGKLDVTVILHDGTQYTAQIVAFEADNDVAVLKIDAEGLKPAVIGDSDSLRVGDTVYAVGNPLGELEFSMTTGHVSAKDRSIVTDNNGESIAMFQIDAPVNSGNSGGPVYNGEGQVVGIVTAKYASSGVEGIGFAIPINDAASIANDLITKGYVTGKARLGVSVNANYNEMYAQYYGWPMGAYIDGTESGSCAEKAGIEKGDIITKFDGEEIKGYDDLRAAVKRHSAGDSVELEVYRADESRIVTVVLDEATPD
ncbi:MAG: trypsin-like peptidase domain-containing protein [Oscillospiraceae bacterium]|nr:trypsin-like peptidase domain-containing protein [Oscillospiraceae bacterium]